MDIGLKDFKPAFAERNIPVAMGADMNYLPFAGVTIGTVLEHNKTGNFDFIILHENIDEKIQRDFVERHASQDRVSIRFIRLGELVRNDVLSGYQTNNLFTIAVFFRLFLPDLLVAYNKVLYLDIDIVVKCDVAELFNQDVSGKLIAGVVDKGTANWAADCPEYRNKLGGAGFNEFDEYVNSGVLVMNLAGMRKKMPFTEWLKLGMDFRKFCPDQDALNLACKGKKLLLDDNWNRLLHLCDEWQRAAEKEENPPPAIYHFSAARKPWANPTVNFSRLWWNYARKYAFQSTPEAFAEFEVLGKTIADLSSMFDARGVEINKLKREIYKLKHETKKQAKEIAELKSSFAYRTGMIVTWPLRLIARAIRALHK